MIDPLTQFDDIFAGARGKQNADSRNTVIAHKLIGGIKIADRNGANIADADNFAAGSCMAFQLGNLILQG